MRGGGRDAYVAAYDACESLTNRERAEEVDPWVANLADQRQLKVRFGPSMAPLWPLYGYSLMCG